jgi:hypothetical protein
MRRVRRRILYRSITRLLPDGDSVHGAAVVWTITARSVLTAMGIGAAVLILLSISSELDGSRLVLWSLLVAAAAAASLTRFRVVALTDAGYVLFAASSVRNVATKLIERLPEGVEPQKLGGNLATSDWSIDGETYMVSKRGEKELERLKARR